MHAQLEDEIPLVKHRNSHDSEANTEDLQREAEELEKSLQHARRHDDHTDANSVEAMIAAVVPLTDDPTALTLTFRVWVVGTILCVIGASVSQLFFFKSNAPSFSSFLIILVSYPIGHWLAKILPSYVSLGSHRFCLNPGPFSVKEHLLIFIIASSGSRAAYGADIISIQDLFYHQDLGPIGGTLLIVTSQMLGFGLSGLVYSILVRPTAMIWPSNLVTITLFNTLHGTDVQELVRKRLHCFKVAFIAMFIWQFIPAVMAPSLTSIALLCWAAGPSTLARVLGSGYSGFGLFNLSLDWSVIGHKGPLYTPFWSMCNYTVGIGTMMWLIMPCLYFANFWSAQKFDTAVSSQLYDSLFKRFDVTSVINSTDLSLNSTAWEAHAPLLLTPYFALSYGISFAVLTSTLVTVWLWNREDIKAALRRDHIADAHIKMMEAYEGVPAKWYAIVGFGTLLAACYLMLFYPLQMPIWLLLLAVALALFFLVPCGIIAATSNTRIGLNVITEFVAGWIIPGQPIGNVTFKCYGYMVMTQALELCDDLKLSVYAKIPPKDMFVCQCYGTTLAGIVNYIFVKSIINAKRAFLDGTLEDPTQQWTGRSPHIFYSASIIWGLVSPQRFFVGKYKYLYLGFPIGAVLPLIPYYLSKRYPRSKIPFNLISWPLILHGAMAPPQTPTNVIAMGFIAAYLSQSWARRRRPKWFEKYNYTLSAGLDAATSINALVIFVLGLSFPYWWGNSSVDSEHCKPGS